jgi:hypothetical protein
MNDERTTGREFDKTKCAENRRWEYPQPLCSPAARLIPPREKQKGAVREKERERKCAIERARGESFCVQKI